MEEAVEAGTVFEKERPEFFIDGEDTVPVGDIDKLKGHTGSAFHGIFVSAGGTETAVASERDKFQITTVGAGIHSPTKRGVSTVNHFLNIFHLNISGMKSILDHFIIICKNF